MFCSNVLCLNQEDHSSPPVSYLSRKVSLPVTIRTLFRCVSKKVEPLRAGARPGPAPDQRETKNVYKSPTQKNKNLETTSLEISFAKEYQ